MIAARPAALAVTVLATGCLSKPTSFECTFAPLPYDLEARIGDDGGGMNATFDCGNQSVVIGVGFGITQTVNGGFNEKTAVSATLRCAPLSTRGGDYKTGDTSDVKITGGGALSDGPFFESCPDGQVVVGLAVHLVDMVRRRLFNSIAIDCSAIDESGAPTGDLTRIPLVATGTRPTDTEVRCTGGKALQGLRSWTGSEMDQVQLGCGKMACLQPP